MDTPSDNQIDGEASFETVGASQLAFLDAASAFEDAMHDFNGPALGVPLQLLDGLLEAIDG